MKTALRPNQGQRPTGDGTDEIRRNEGFPEVLDELKVHLNFHLYSNTFFYLLSLRSLAV